MASKATPGPALGTGSMIYLQPSGDEVRIVDGNMRMRAALDLGMSVPFQLEGVGQGEVSKDDKGVVYAVFPGGRRMRVAGF